MLGMCESRKREVCTCADCTTCKTKEMINMCIEYQDFGRIELLKNSKHLTDRGRLTVSILKMLDVEEVKDI